jgi:hypothetical protein
MKREDVLGSLKNRLIAILATCSEPCATENWNDILNETSPLKIMRIGISMHGVMYRGSPRKGWLGVCKFSASY